MIRLVVVDHLDVSMMCVGCSFRFRMRFWCCHRRQLCIAVDDFRAGCGQGGMVDEHQGVHYLVVDDLDSLVGLVVVVVDR